jgi:thiamine pyrophosphate-dependent acetolactate synthase large subunit-like protein
MSELEGRGAAWTEERETSDEGRRRLPAPRQRAGEQGQLAGRTVREAAFEVARRCAMMTWFGNPGSTEIPLLADLPDDIRYVLALHESAAVGMAAGYAIGTGSPALVSLHTTAGLGNAVSALATARTNRAPLVVLVGQQDRRHLLAEPFLAGRLDGLAGSYPLEVFQPPAAQDVPGCIAQAWHVAGLGSGPVIVIVPMGDWDELAGDLPVPAPAVSAAAAGVGAADVAAIAALLNAAAAPVLVTGAGADSAATWAALTDLADRLDCPVFQEPFTARAGFPQDHPRFAGFLPAGRAALRAALAPYDAVLVVGAALLRQYHYEPGPLVEPGTATAVISQDPAEVRRSPADIGLVAPLAAAVATLASAVAPVTARRPAPTGQAEPLRARLAERATGMTPEALFARLAPRLAADTIVVEETPSSREALQLMIPARRPLGYVGLAMGGLGFGMPAAIGLRMALPDRPVLAVIGDGSSVYCIQALWSAARYGVGVVFFVMDNGHYLVMDELTRRRGQIPWPSLSGVSVHGLAAALGVESVCVYTPGQLAEIVESAAAGLRDRGRPLLVNVRLEAAS